LIYIHYTVSHHSHFTVFRDVPSCNLGTIYQTKRFHADKANCVFAASGTTELC